MIARNFGKEASCGYTQTKAEARDILERVGLHHKEQVPAAVLEEAVRALAQRRRLDIEILGRADGVLPSEGELGQVEVAAALMDLRDDDERNSEVIQLPELAVQMHLYSTD